MTNCKIPQTAVIGMTAVLLCGCAGQKALDAEPPASAQEVLEETAEGAVAECITEFHGTITVNEKPEPVDLYYYQESENEYFYELDVGGQSITVPMRDDLLPSSLSGFEICDVNRDGKDDILINLGIYGKARPMDCFLCTEESDFIRMDDFTELFIPVWKPASGTILDCGGAGDTYWMKRYKVVGTELVLLETLDWIYINGGSPRYTQKKLVNGELITVLDSVPESEVDLTRWDQ